MQSGITHISHESSTACNTEKRDLHLWMAYCLLPFFDLLWIISATSSSIYYVRFCVMYNMVFIKNSKMLLLRVGKTQNGVDSFEYTRCSFWNVTWAISSKRFPGKVSKITMSEINKCNFIRALHNGERIIFAASCRFSALNEMQIHIRKHCLKNSTVRWFFETFFFAKQPCVS